MAKSKMPHRGEKSQVYCDMAGKNKTEVGHINFRVNALEIRAAFWLGFPSYQLEIIIPNMQVFERIKDNEFKEPHIGPVPYEIFRNGNLRMKI